MAVKQSARQGRILVRTELRIAGSMDMHNNKTISRYPSGKSVFRIVIRNIDCTSTRTGVELNVLKADALVPLDWCGMGEMMQHAAGHAPTDGEKSMTNPVFVPNLLPDSMNCSL
jgi:hypothetical protein